MRTLLPALAHLVLIAFSAAILLPLLWLLKVSLTASTGPAAWAAPQLDSYVELLTATPFTGWLLSSLLVGLGSTALALPLATALAYALARYGTGGSALHYGLLAGLMLPPIILALPLLAVALSAGLRGTPVALIVAHAACNLPLLAWIAATSLHGVRQLEEAARLEGASRLQAFRKVAVPVAGPGILAAGVIGFVLSWNELLLALILSGPATTTVPAGLAMLGTQGEGRLALSAAAILVSCLPVFLLVPLLRRWLGERLSLRALQ